MGGAAPTGRATGAGRSVEKKAQIRKESGRTLKARDAIRRRLNRGAKSTKVRARQADVDFAAGTKQGLAKFKERPELSPAHRRQLGARAQNLKRRLQEIDQRLDKRALVLQRGK